jgi:superfamily II DNA or RNA helicase
VLGQLTMLSEPLPTVVGKVPRPYQLEGINAAIRDLTGAHDGTILAHFTGAGKSFEAAQLAKWANRELGGRVLVVAGLTTIVDQLWEGLQENTGEQWDLEQANFRASVNGRNNVVASVQTLSQPYRLSRWPRDAFKLVIYDELHTLMGKKYRSPLEYFAAKRIGLTATPDGYKRGYLPLFTSECHRLELPWAIENTWATPVDFESYDSKVSLDGVAWANGDFKPEALDEAIAKVVAPIVKAAVSLCGDLPTAIFCPGVKTAHTVSKALNEVKSGSAMAVDGYMPRDEKRAIIKSHRRREFQFLVNKQLLGIGYDDEELLCILDADPTGKRHKAIQKWGRVTRLWPTVARIMDDQERRAALAASPKPRARIICLGFHSDEHDLVGPADVLGGDYTEKERKRANKRLNKYGGDPLEALKEAREIEAENARKRAEKAAEKARQSARAQAANGAEVELKELVGPANDLGPGEHALSPGQQRLLESWGIDTTGLTKAAAQKIIGKEKLCERFGWCGHNRRLKLQRAGVPESQTWAMKVSTGEAIWNAWHANGKQTLTPEQIAKVISNQ